MFNQQSAAADGRGLDSRAEGTNALQDDEPPDVKVARLTREAVEKSGGKLTLSLATIIAVLKANPELAEAYRYQTGIKDG